MLKDFQFSSADSCFKCCPVLIGKYINMVDPNFYFENHQKSVKCCRSDWMLIPVTLCLTGLHIIFRWLRQSWGQKKTNEIGWLFCSGASSGVLTCPLPHSLSALSLEPKGICPWMQCTGLALQLLLVCCFAGLYTCGRSSSTAWPWPFSQGEMPCAKFQFILKLFQ